MFEKIKRPMQPALTLNGAEVEAIEAAIELAFDTGLQDRTAMLIESVAALSTIDTLISIAKKRQNEENRQAVETITITIGEETEEDEK